MTRNRIIMVLFGAAMLLALAAAFYAPRAPESMSAPVPAPAARPIPFQPGGSAPEPTQADIPPPRPFGPPDMAPNRSK